MRWIHFILVDIQDHISLRNILTDSRSYSLFLSGKTFCRSRNTMQVWKQLHITLSSQVPHQKSEFTSLLNLSKSIGPSSGLPSPSVKPPPPPLGHEIWTCSKQNLMNLKPRWTLSATFFHRSWSTPENALTSLQVSKPPN